ncbi:hypothetical protein BN1723_010385, partial [Verticillium longisporum]
MATLKRSQPKSPIIVDHGLAVIYISDYDSSGGDDSGEECDFEDVMLNATVSVVGYTEARFEELADDTINDDKSTPDGVSSDEESDSGVTDGLPLEKGGAREMEDEGIATDMTPHHDDGGVSNWDLHDDEASRTEPVDQDQDDNKTHGLPSLRDIVVQLGALRGRVAQLEAQ